MDDMDEFKQIFFTECAELLGDMEARLLNLEEGATDKEALNAIFRCAHSIKGGSGAFGLDAIMQFTHALEALLDKMRDGSLLPTRASIDTLLKSADIVTQMLEFAKKNQPVPATLGSDVLATLHALTQGAPLPAPVAAAPVIVPAAEVSLYRYTIVFKPHAELFASGNDPLLILRELGRLGQIELSIDTARVPLLDALDPTHCLLSWTIVLESKENEETLHEVFEFVQDISDLKITRQEAAPAAVTAPAAPVQEVSAVAAEVTQKSAETAPKPAEAGKAAVATSIRVDLEKVDRLVNMVGELVITEAMLRAQVRDLAEDQFSNLLRGIDELSHHTRELQEAVMAVRMQPVKSIFSRMPRIVRDTATQLGKDIQLVLSGENTEVDKTVIEQLSDPLTHMIRNSCDHGIETPDQRVWNDKPVQGTIHLAAYQRSGRIIIEISDDGAGINRQRVLGNRLRPRPIMSDVWVDRLKGNSSSRRIPIGTA